MNPELSKESISLEKLSTIQSKVGKLVSTVEYGEKSVHSITINDSISKITLEVESSSSNFNEKNQINYILVSFSDIFSNIQTKNLILLKKNEKENDDYFNADFIIIKNIKYDKEGKATWTGFSERSGKIIFGNDGMMALELDKIFENRKIEDLNSDYFKNNHSYKNLEQFLQNIET